MKNVLSGNGHYEISSNSSLVNDEFFQPFYLTTDILIDCPDPSIESIQPPLVRHRQGFLSPSKHQRDGYVFDAGVVAAGEFGEAGNAEV